MQFLWRSVCVNKQIQNVCLRMLWAQENTFVQGFVIITLVGEETVHLFINKNEVALFKNKIL